MLRSAGRYCWYSLVLLLLVLALVQGAIRWALPLWLQDNPDVQAWLSKSLGSPVQYQALVFNWDGLDPSLQLQSLSLGSALKLKRLDVRLDLWNSLWQGQWHTKQLELAGLQLQLQQHAEGWQVSGINEASDSQSDVSQVWRTLLQQQQIRLTELRLAIRPLHGPLWQLAAPQLQWRRDQHLSQLEGQAKLIGPNSATPVRLVIEQRNQAQAPIQLYLSGDKLPLAPMSTVLGQNVKLDGWLDLRLWATWLPEHQQPQVDAQLDVHQLQIQAAKQPAFNLERWQGRLAWQADWAYPWQLSDIRISDAKLDWPLAQARLGWSMQPDKLDWRMQAERIELARLTRWLQQLPLTTKPKLTGLVTDPDFQGQWSATTALQWQVTAGFEQLTLATEQWSLASGLKGQLHADAKQLQVRLDPAPLTLDTGGLFRWPLVFDQFSGQFNWLADAEGWHLNSNELHFSRGQQELVALLNLQQQAHRPLMVDLYAEVHNGDAKETPKYLPTVIMQPELVQFLDKAIVDGQVPLAQVVLRGPLAEFPFNQHQGSFIVDAQVQQGRFRFSPDWPELSQLQSRLRFEGTSMQIDTKAGAIAGIAIAQAQVAIRDFRSTPTWLLVNGKAQHSSEQALALLAQSPLRFINERIANLHFAKGQLKTRFNLSLALDNLQLLLQGDTEFRKLALDAGHGLNLNNLSGKLQFTEQGAEVKQGRGQLWGQDLNWSWLNNNQGDQFKLQASLPLSQISRIAPSPWWSSVQGNLPFELSASSAHSGPLQLKLESDLVGVALQLPEPLTKASSQAAKLRLAAELADNSGKITLNYNQLVQASALLQKNQLTGLSLNVDRPLVAAQPGVQIRARLPQLDLELWRQWLLPQLTGSGPSLALTLLELSSAKLLVGGITWPQFELRMKGKSLSQPWFEFSSRDFAGQVKAGAKANSPWQVDLSRCYLQAEHTKPTPPVANSVMPVIEPEAPDLDPRLIPALDFSCQELRWRQTALGQLRFSARPHPQGLRVDDIQLQGPQVQLDAIADWKVAAVGQLSLISGTLTSSDVGAFLTSLDGSSSIKESAAKLVFDFNWLGGLHQFRLKKLNGNLNLDLSAGRLEEVSDKGARLLSLLSLETLSRRLRLDFSDIFQKGFFFSSLKGDFRLKLGDAYTDNTLLDGLAANVEIHGRTGLAQQDVDQQLTVIPKSGSSLPLIAAWAVNPATGAAVFLLDKLFSPAIRVITAIQYRAVGPWDKIELHEIRKQEQEVEAPAHD